MCNKFMLRAMELARQAAKDGEIPVGAVIVKDGIILAEGRNRREEKQNTLSHAECEAINYACKKLNSWRLTGCDIYVTLEPCPMCAGAIINARIDNVYYGASDGKWGSADSVIRLFGLFESRPQFFGGIMENEAEKLLKDFFKERRKEEKNEN